MKINFTNKTNKNKIYFIINGKNKIKDEKLLSFVDKFRYEKWEDFKIEIINTIDENHKKITNILVFVKNNKKLKKNIENIIVQLWNIIINTNWKYSLSMKKLEIEKENQELFVDLLAQKLYKYEEFLSKKTKYSINIDANIDEEIIKNKIENIYFARDLENKPANILNPEKYEQIIKESFKNNKNVKIKVIKWEELEKIWANWIYSVWKWSKYEPRMIILEYKVEKNNKFNAIVWKWVTFDSGGYNIKPSWYIEDMHLDMWGSAVVLWTFKHLTETNYNKNLICAVWIVENLVSDKSYSPTDIIKMYNWKTVHVQNTDAEWRLVLWDVLSYVEKNYNINYIFDFATLTWAAVIALWNDISTIMWRNKKLIEKMVKRSWDLKERCWELPLYSWYNELLKSPFADLKNIWGKSAWTITAGLFLSNFVENKNWIHFDIAWPEITENNKIYGTWGSWIWVRLLVDILKNI